MTSVSRLSGAEPNVVRKGADAVRGNDFAADIPVKKLARSTKDRENERGEDPQIGDRVPVPI